MADINDFGPLSADQLRRVQRDAVTTEIPSWMELMLGGGLGGGLGRMAGRGVARMGDEVSGMMFPTLGGLARMGGHSAKPIVDWVGRGGGAIGGLGGLTAAADVSRDRAMRNTMRDAEGQVGGFYGPASPMDAEGQLGGFYGRRPVGLAR